VTPLVNLQELSIGFCGPTGPRILNSCFLQIEAGEIHGLVGESGSGKSLLSRSMLGLLPPGASIVGGSIDWRGEPIDWQDKLAARTRRGREIGFISQEPMSSLTPTMRVGTQLIEAQRVHSAVSISSARQRARNVLDRVGLSSNDDMLRRYPHELSGGMRQRLMIGIAIINRPKLIIADEPTTALDSITQREILDLLAQLTREDAAAVLLITHDIALAALYAHQLTVLRHGTVVESGLTADILAKPQNPYTRTLLTATANRERAEDAREEPTSWRIENLSARYSRLGRGRDKAALEDVSFEVRKGRLLAIVGQSGSGKTTLLRCITGLMKPSRGTLTRFDAGAATHLELGAAGFASVIFQDPFSSLNPRLRVDRAVADQIRFRDPRKLSLKLLRARRALRRVGLNKTWFSRFPHQLSGGQRQRVAIARAIVGNNKVVVADEPFAALDVENQRKMAALFRELCDVNGAAGIVITHDLRAVEQVCDDVIVLSGGRIVEYGPASRVLKNPAHPYTRRLLAAEAAIVSVGHGFAVECDHRVFERSGGHSDVK